ncbi:MAG: ribosome small subunit-dependent GTPase A [Parcubacteria group bacterium]|nr:MAG: ribosome small subunit-dependent GTPase A [Parcubacteria group bacterium]
MGGFPVARVIAEHKGAYRVKNVNGEYLAKITGQQMFNALSREDFPAVGDWVAITELDEERAVIHKVLPRMTIIKRKYSSKNETQVIATNIDVALVIESVDGDYNLNRFERYFAIAAEGGIKPAIVLNKTDLISKKELDSKLAQIKNRFNDIEVIPTSTITDEGLEELKKFILRGKTYCFLGSSGVGKSSLINKLLERDVLKTKTISLRTGRGKHATTGREMYFLKNGGIVIDNPGMREVGMTDTGTGIDSLFDEITALAEKCRYVDCTHVHEPGCEVLSAVKSGKLDEDKYYNYINLKKEVEYYETTALEKREKDHQFGKFIKKAKKEIERYKH